MMEEKYENPSSVSLRSTASPLGSQVGDGGRMVSTPTGGPETEIARVIQTVMDPVLRAMAQMIEQNVEALRDIAAQQKVVNERLDELETQIRRNTPVTPTMVKYINRKIREVAVERLSVWENKEDGFFPQKSSKAVNRLARCIRCDVLTRYGASALNEIPRNEYAVVLDQIDMWNARITVKNAAEEARC